MMYLRAVRLGKEEHETLREYSTRIDKRLQIVQKNLGDYVEVFEEAFYDEKIPEVVEIEAVEAFFQEVKSMARRRLLPFRYRRLRLVEFFILHR